MSYLSQLNAAKASGIFDVLQEAAEQHGLSLPYLLAIASRESDITNVIGDGGHGIGVIQIDIRSHPIAAQAKADGSWATKEGMTKLINYGAEMLKENIAWARHTYPDYGHVDGRGWLKIAASAYNAGRGGAKAGVAQGDSDLRTAGADYGKDVLNRMDQFAALV